MMEKILAEQQMINKEQLELAEENQKMIATGAIVALSIGLSVGLWNHFQNKRLQSQLEQQQREQEQRREQQQRVTRTKTTEVIRDPNGGATFRETITDERPVGDNHDAPDNENSTLLLALREFTRPAVQGQGHIVFHRTSTLTAQNRLFTQILGAETFVSILRCEFKENMP